MRSRVTPTATAPARRARLQPPPRRCADEPVSALDMLSGPRIEDPMHTTLRKHYVVVIVTRNVHRTGRVAGHTTFMHLGKLGYDRTDFLEPGVAGN